MLSQWIEEECQHHRAANDAKVIPEVRAGRVVTARGQNAERHHENKSRGDAPEPSAGRVGMRRSRRGHSRRRARLVRLEIGHPVIPLIMEKQQLQALATVARPKERPPGRSQRMC